MAAVKVADAAPIMRGLKDEFKKLISERHDFDSYSHSVHYNFGYAGLVAITRFYLCF